MLYCSISAWLEWMGTLRTRELSDEFHVVPPRKMDD